MIERCSSAGNRHEGRRPSGSHIAIDEQRSIVRELRTELQRTGIEDLTNSGRSQRLFWCQPRWYNIKNGCPWTAVDANFVSHTGPICRIALQKLFARRVRLPWTKRRGETMTVNPAIIDDLSCEPGLSAIGTKWQLFTDRVMGGVSTGTMVREMVAGRPAIRMRGDVSIENNGGFVQIALDLAADGKAIDASAWRGVELHVFGNDEEYNIHLRTDDLTRPWQSYRQSFHADPQWRTARFRFQDFAPYRTDAALDTRKLRRIGLVAIGRTFSADLSIAGLRYLS
jgi:Complex I intermediate-associated protein 30 (CIA30)